MRVLIVSFAEKSHFQATVPLGWALRAAGHEVLAAAQPELLGAAAGTGLPVAPVGADHRLYRTLDRLTRLLGDDPAGAGTVGYGLDPHGLDALSWPDWVRFYRQNVGLWWRLVNEPLLPELVALCRSWRPDLVLWEALTFAGAVAARAVGAAHVRLLFGSDLLTPARERFLALRSAQPPDRRADPLADWLGASARRYGTDFSEELVAGQATVSYLPAPLRLGPADVEARYVPYNGRALVPGWLREPPRRPRVCVTLGTSAAERFGGYAGSVPDLLAGVADLDVEVVATVPEPQGVVVPPNVRLVPFVPLDALAATCSAVVDHGGAATVCTVLRHGVPQLVVPHAMYDEELLGDLLAGAGAGATLPPAAATAAAVRDAVGRLLTDPGIRSGARRLAAVAAAMPTPADLVPRLERLARRPAPPAGPRAGRGPASRAPRPAAVRPPGGTPDR